MDVVLWLVGAVVGLLAIPSLAQLVVERRWRHRWVVESSRPADLDVEGQGAFREATIRATVPTVERVRAPRALRAMAYSCWFLGQMAIPGFLAWAVGLLVYTDVRHGAEPIFPTLMASFFPGVLCAWLVWSAGSSLVRGERDRADRETRRTMRAVVAYNALAIALAVGWFVVHPSDYGVWFSVAYCAVSIVHAVALRATFAAHRGEFPVENEQR